MQLKEIFADESGDTHFREARIDLALRELLPPSKPVRASAEIPVTSAILMECPPGWDPSPHPTPRRQLCIMLRGRMTISATDGETVLLTPGTVVLINDPASKGHVSIVQEGEDARFMLVGLGA